MAFTIEYKLLSVKLLSLKSIFVMLGKPRSAVPKWIPYLSPIPTCFKSSPLKSFFLKISAGLGLKSSAIQSRMYCDLGDIAHNSSTKSSESCFRIGIVSELLIRFSSLTS